MDELDLFARASDWTLEKVAGATDQLDVAGACGAWDVRTLLNHMLATQQYFVGSARGEDVAPPSSEPPELLGDDPVADFERARSLSLEVFSDEAVRTRTGPALGIAFSDQLVHGWDLATATGQDATMPAGLAEAAYDVIHGRFSAEQRPGVFEPEVPVPDGASAQDRLLAYTGRTPA